MAYLWPGQGPALSGPSPRAKISFCSPSKVEPGARPVSCPAVHPPPAPTTEGHAEKTQGRLLPASRATRHYQSSHWPALGLSAFLKVLAVFSHLLLRQLHPLPPPTPALCQSEPCQPLPLHGLVSFSEYSLLGCFLMCSKKCLWFCRLAGLFSLLKDAAWGGGGGGDISSKLSTSKRKQGAEISLLGGCLECDSLPDQRSQHLCC